MGERWDHERRQRDTHIEEAVSVAPLYLLVKDHKNYSGDGPPPTRPVQSTDVLQAALDTVAQAQGHIANLRHQLAPLQSTSRFRIQERCLLIDASLKALSEVSKEKALQRHLPAPNLGATTLTGPLVGIQRCPLTCWLSVAHFTANSVTSRFAHRKRYQQQKRAF